GWGGPRRGSAASTSPPPQRTPAAESTAPPARSPPAPCSNGIARGGCWSRRPRERGGRLLASIDSRRSGARRESRPAGAAVKAKREPHFRAASASIHDHKIVGRPRHDL